MKLLFDAVLEFFEEDGWSFSKIENDSALYVNFGGKHGQWTCYARTRESLGQFVFYSVCPVVVPEDKLQAIAEFVNRANYGLMIGNFELGYEDGSLHYKTSIDVQGATLSSILIQHLVYENTLTMDKYLPGILAVVSGNLSPLQAIAQVEKRKQS